MMYCVDMVSFSLNRICEYDYYVSDETLQDLVPLCVLKEVIHY